MAKTKDEEKAEPQESEKAPEVEATETAPDASGVDVAQVLANAGDVNVRSATGENTGVLTNEFLSGDEGDKFKGWVVGQPAPETKWLDKDRETVLDEPRFTAGVGSRLIEKGETVTEVILAQLKAGSKK
jgi:hypothetical protein